MENISHCNSLRDETQQDIWKYTKMFVHRRKHLRLNGLDSLMNKTSQNMSSKSHWNTIFPHNNCSVKVQSNTTTCLLYELSSQRRRADNHFPNRHPMPVSISSEKRIFLLEMWISFSAVDAWHSFADQCCQ